MSGDNVRKMVDQILGKEDEQQLLHVQTVKISLEAHAKLRALADLTSRSKTPIAADLLMAAIDDAIEELPNDPLDEATSDKLRGITYKWGIELNAPRGLRDIVLERAYLLLDVEERDRWGKEKEEVVSQNGAYK
jgi:hypothetical protein